MIRITRPWLVTMALAAGPGCRLEVAGLACPYCSYGIEKQLRRIEGVATTEVDVRAVERAGFTLDGFESQAPATWSEGVPSMIATAARLVRGRDSGPVVVEHRGRSPPPARGSVEIHDKEPGS